MHNARKFISRETETCIPCKCLQHILQLWVHQQNHHELFHLKTFNQSKIHKLCLLGISHLGIARNPCIRFLNCFAFYNPKWKQNRSTAGSVKYLIPERPEIIECWPLDPEFITPTIVSRHKTVLKDEFQYILCSLSTTMFVSLNQWNTNQCYLI